MAYWRHLNILDTGMRTALLYILIIFFCSCGARKSRGEKTDIKILEKKDIQVTAPGDRVYISLPQKERPRREQKVYSGKAGATTVVTFDDNGIVTHILTDCPPVQTRDRMIKDLEQRLREKEVDREEAVGWKGFFWSFTIGFLLGIIVWVTKPWKQIFSWTRLMDFFR